MVSHRLPDEGERFAAFALRCVRGLRRSNLQDLCERHGSLEGALEAVPGAREAGLRGLENLRKNGAWGLLPGDPDWPQRLGQTKPPVELLFVRGNLELSKPTIAVVGSRHATQYGLSFAAELASALASDGCSIVSGGALGIDGAAHRGALACGRTVVVLGGGLDRPYPPQHRSLFDEVLATGGALVSEAPFGTEARAQLFPRRNRIIAALSRAVIVVQAARGSGSLITARLARELDLPVFAVPGAPGDAVAEGTKDLLRSGAYLCLGPEEVRAALGLVGRKIAEASLPASSAKAHRDPTLNRLKHVIGVSPRPLDDLARAAGLSAQRTAVAMTRLELLGFAARAPGGGFFRPPPEAGGHESLQRSDGPRIKDAQ
jgi:DNA processing protein